MEKKTISVTTLTLLLMSMLMLELSLQPVEARFYPGPGKGAATIYITPQYNNFTYPPTTNGTWFTVNVRIANATFVAAWEVELWYNRNYLYTNSSLVEYSSDMIFPSGTYAPKTPLVDLQNSTHNHVAEVAATYGRIEYNATDAGLITVRFQIIKTPTPGQTLSTILYLPALPEAGFGTWTLDKNSLDNDLTVFDGYFRITSSRIVPDDYPTIQEAINHANAGDTVHVKAGTYYEHVIVNKTLSLVGENKSTTIVDGSGSGNVIQVEANNAVVQGFRIQNGQYGILLNFSNSGNLFENQVQACELGIYLVTSSNNTVSRNLVTGNIYGIRTINSSQYNLIKENTLSNNQEGIHLNTDYNNVIDNIMSNNDIGINLWAWYNNITGNTLSNNTPIWAIRIEASNYNRLYHNNFYNVGIFWTGVVYNENIWDNGCEGNYWSDYNGTDTDSDGVGDTFLPWKGVDYCPLMNPFWNLGDITHDLKVDGRDVARVARSFGSLPTDPKWNPHADVNEDGKIDGKDIALVAKNFGKIYP